MLKKGRALHAMDTRFSRTLKDRVRQRVLQTFADQIFLNEDSPVYPRAFVGFVQIFLDKRAKTVKYIRTFSLSVHVVLLNFSEDYEKKMINYGHSLVPSLQDEAEKRDGRKEANIGGLENQYMLITRPRYRMVRNQYSSCPVRRGRER